MALSPDESLSLYLDVAVQAANEAGERIKAAFYGKDKSIDTKSSFTDLVTATDKQCEDVIKGIIKSRFPSHKFIGEESVASSDDKVPTLDDEPVWMVDPVDGTTNFVHSFPLCCVSIGLVTKNVVVVAVVFNPILEETFTAIRGQGSKLNGQTISVSNRDSLSTALVGTEIGTSRDAETLDAITGRIRLVAAQCRGIRCCGSCAVNLCSVAMGRLDAFYEIGFGGCWDAAAGSLIVEEAGGLVLDPDGGKFNLMSRRVLAGAPAVATAIGKILSDAPLSSSEPK